MTNGEIRAVKDARSLIVFVRDRLATPPGATRGGVTYEGGGILWQRANRCVTELDRVLGEHAIL